MEFVSRPPVVLQLLVQGSHRGQLEHYRERVDADPDEGNDVRVFQVNQDVQLLPVMSCHKLDYFVKLIFSQC